MSQWRKRFSRALNHSDRPASPELISCPPPISAMMTHQSSCLSNTSIKNSGSDELKFTLPFFWRMNLTVWCWSQARWASSKTTTRSAGGSSDSKLSSRKWWMFWIKVLVCLRASSMEMLWRLLRSLAKASWRTFTNGPFPDKKTACSSSTWFIWLVVTDSPARVLPAPGTPVTKHIAFLLVTLAFLMIREISSAVSLRFVALASLLEISVTSWSR